MSSPPAKPAALLPALAARHLGVTRGDGRSARTVVEGVGFHLESGRCLGVIGPNGSGKSTLLAGLRGLAPCRGEVWLGERPLDSLSRREIAHRIAVVPQRMEFAFPYTVEEMVLFGRAPHRRPWQPFRERDRAVARAIVDRLGLSALAHTPVDAISGGERRKVFIARALAQETPLLFLDEPTAGLDPGVQEELIALLGELCAEEGRAVVAVLHDVRVALRICDEVLALKEGRVLFQGAPREVVEERSLARLFDVGWQRYRGATGDVALLPGAAHEREGRAREEGES